MNAEMTAFADTLRIATSAFESAGSAFNSVLRPAQYAGDRMTVDAHSMQEFVDCMSCATAALGLIGPQLAALQGALEPKTIIVPPNDPFLQNEVAALDRLHGEMMQIADALVDGEAAKHNSALHYIARSIQGMGRSASARIKALHLLTHGSP
jgi:hypothetical protein